MFDDIRDIAALLLYQLKNLTNTSSCILLSSVINKNLDTNELEAVIIIIVKEVMHRYETRSNLWTICST